MWVENGDLMFYAQRSGALRREQYDAGRQDATDCGSMTPGIKKASEKTATGSVSVFDDRSFRQTLHVYDGYVSVATDKVNVSIWVDVFRPVIHVDIRGASCGHREL